MNGTLRWAPDGPFSAHAAANYVGRQKVSQTVSAAAANTHFSADTMVPVVLGGNVLRYMEQMIGA